MEIPKAHPKVTKMNFNSKEMKVEILFEDGTGITFGITESFAKSIDRIFGVI